MLAEMGSTDARGALRMTLGRSNTRAEVDEFVEILPSLVERVRGLTVS